MTQRIYSYVPLKFSWKDRFLLDLRHRLTLKYLKRAFAQRLSNRWNMVDGPQNFLQAYVFDLIQEGVWWRVFDVQQLNEILLITFLDDNNLLQRIQNCYTKVVLLLFYYFIYPFFQQIPFHAFFYHYYQMQHLITGSKFLRLLRHCSFLEDQHQDVEAANLEFVGMF